MLAPMTTACSLCRPMARRVLGRERLSDQETGPGSRTRKERGMAGGWRTKSIEQSIADTDDPESRLRKDLTWRDLCVFGVAVVIGAGIFTITASTAGNLTGPAI